jgi:putative ABC transport system permease protein
VAIVNSTFVRDLLGGKPPLDMMMTMTVVAEPVRIVGVVADVTPGGQPDRPAVYVPFDQLSVAGGSIVVRTKTDPRFVIPALTQRLRAAMPGLAIDRVRRVAEDLEQSRAVLRFTTQVSAAFATLALVLSMIGVYGLTAGDVAGRRQEVAVRVALGASRRETLWTVIRPSACLVGAGAAIGVTAATGVGPALRSVLEGIGPTDVPTLLSASLLLVVVEILAAGLAASRIIRVDPATTLRSP